jgi:hypothetical protein
MDPRSRSTDRFPQGSARWLLAIGVATSLAAAQAPASGKKPSAPATLPPLNQKVVEFAREQVGKKVGSGECTSLAVAALKHAGARRFRGDPSGDFVWGRPVPAFKDALPGDVLQFRDAVFQGKRWLTGRRWTSWHQEYPHHTAIVAEVRDGGREVSVLHQNVGKPGTDEKAKRIVQEDAIRPGSLQKGGQVWIYRPVGPDDDLDPLDSNPAGAPRTPPPDFNGR